MWFGRDAADLPVHKILPFSKKIFASYTGPESGLTIVEKLMQGNATKGQFLNLIKSTLEPIFKFKDFRFVYLIDEGEDKDEEKENNMAPFSIVGCEDWNIKNRKAYGISMSLYDQHPISLKITGCFNYKNFIFTTFSINKALKLNGA